MCPSEGFRTQQGEEGSVWRHQGTGSHTMDSNDMLDQHCVHWPAETLI